MLRSLALLLAVFTLLAPAYAAGAERGMQAGDADCGCCCAGNAPSEAPAEQPTPSELPTIDAPACGCSVPPSVPPTAPLEAPLGGAASSLTQLDLQHAPVVALLPLPAPVRARTQADEEPARVTCCRVQLGVWLL